MRAHIRQAWLGGALLALGALVLVIPIGRVWAHADLVSSEPADGDTLADPPASLLFTFGEDLMSEGAGITAEAVASGQRVDLAAVTVSGDSVSVDWPAATPPGQYRASYRVVSEDGHAVSGSITFTIEGAGSSPADQGVSASPVAETSSPPIAAAASPTAEPSPAPGGGGAGALGWILGLGIVVLVGAGAGTWFTRRSRGL